MITGKVVSQMVSGCVHGGSSLLMYCLGVYVGKSHHMFYPSASVIIRAIDWGVAYERGQRQACLG